jgi:hypothetical protein
MLFSEFPLVLESRALSSVSIEQLEGSTVEETSLKNLGYRRSFSTDVLSCISLHFRVRVMLRQPHQFGIANQLLPSLR